MYRVFLFWLVLSSMVLAPMFLSSTAMAEITDSQIWINELHYDNDGADKNEFVEVVAPVSLTDLSEVTLTLYNGSNGASYGGPTGLDVFTPGDTVDGFVFYSLEVSLQNGAPDGLALARGTDVLQFLSYEGKFNATNGVAQGLLSTDIGVLETTSTPIGSSLRLAGTGDSYFDFGWQTIAPNTPGALNQGQTVVPEPASLVLWLLGVGSPLLFWRWRQHQGASHTSPCRQAAVLRRQSWATTGRR